MARRVLVTAGWVLIVVGLVAGLGSLAMPWAHLRTRATAFNTPVEAAGSWSIFNVSGGLWYTALILTLAGLVGAAALSTGQMRMVAGVAAPILGLITAIMVIMLVNSITPTTQTVAAGFADIKVDPRVAAGAWWGLIAAPTLGFGASLLAIGRTRESGDLAPATVGSATVDSGTAGSGTRD